MLIKEGVVARLSLAHGFETRAGGVHEHTGCGMLCWDTEVADVPECILAIAGCEKRIKPGMLPVLWLFWRVGPLLCLIVNDRVIRCCLSVVELRCRPLFGKGAKRRRAG